MFTFILASVAITLPGILSPGPITAASLAAGTRNRHAGLWIALGHALVEFPLIAILVAGAGTVLGTSGIRTAVGLAGGAVLVLMGGQLLVSLRKPAHALQPATRQHPLWIGVALTAANPYFLIWWATVGFTLTSRALDYGLLVLGVFAVVHWLCDLGWFEALSLAGFQGSQRFGGKIQKAVLAVCGIVLLGFGAKFIVDALGRLGPMA